MKAVITYQKSHITLPPKVLKFVAGVCSFTFHCGWLWRAICTARGGILKFNATVAIYNIFKKVFGVENFARGLADLLVVSQ